MVKNQNHVRGRKANKEFPGNKDLDTRDLEKRNEARSAGLPGEEPRNVIKAGRGAKGQNLGGAHEGRSTSRPAADREREHPRGRR